jgi:hypothetical protein
VTVTRVLTVSVPYDVVQPVLRARRAAGVGLLLPKNHYEYYHGRSAMSLLEDHAWIEDEDDGRPIMTLRVVLVHIRPSINLQLSLILTK